MRRQRESGTPAVAGGTSPLGQRISPNDRGPYTVVGVVADVRRLGLTGEFQPAVYLPFTTSLAGDRSQRTMAVTASIPETVLENAIAEIDPKAAITVSTMRERAINSVSRQSFQAVVLGLFAAVAVFLAALGIYSVVAHSVTTRTREIGIRMAIGARRSEVFVQIVRRGLLPTIVGLGAGLLASFALSRVLAGYLFGITPTDAETYVAVTLAMTAVMILACSIPAHRAMHIDPVEALRCE